jgi:hypothetical protein
MLFYMRHSSQRSPPSSYGTVDKWPGMAGKVGARTSA